MIDLLPDEKIIVGIRKHWLIFLFQTLPLILGALLPVILIPFYDTIFAPAVASLGADRFQNLVAFFVGGWVLLMIIIFFVLLTIYYLNILIITNERVIEVTQDGLFARDIAVCPLEKIEDVKVEVLGIFPTFFKFGNLYIQTAAESREILVFGIRYPEYARDTIMKVYEEVRLNKTKA